MTEEEILAVEVGSELDALIHKQVFDEKVLRIGDKNFPPGSREKFSVYRCCSCGCEAPAFLFSSAGSSIDVVSRICWNCKGREGRPLHGLMGQYLPHYSTDISAAWLVVEKLRGVEDGEGNQLLCCLKIHCDVPGEVWDIHWSYSEFSVVDDKHKDHILPLSWQEFPEAICKAALLISYGEDRL